jgi:hypothetical protein
VPAGYHIQPPDDPDGGTSIRRVVRGGGDDELYIGARANPDDAINVAVTLGASYIAVNVEFMGALAPALAALTGQWSRRDVARIRCGRQWPVRSAVRRGGRAPG